MAVVVGIDEAGYGPILGPLVVSAVAFEVPDDRADACLWETCRASITKHARKKDHRLLIADSKKVYSNRKGLDALERAPLVMLAAAGNLPNSFLSLAGDLCVRLIAELAEYPWYVDFDAPLPFACNAGGILTHANAVGKDMQSQGIRFLGAWSEPLLEGHYNAMIDSMHNKATVLLNQTFRLVSRASDLRKTDAPLRVQIDRQGGRRRYAQVLMRSFELNNLEIVGESPERSAYEIDLGGRPCQIEFTKDGEDRYMPVALASMFSKLLRELFMVAFNRYWRTRVSGVAPTAGYYQDAQRFLADIGVGDAAGSANVQKLIRKR